MNLRAFSVTALGVFGIVFSVFVVITDAFPELPPGNILGGIGGCLLNGVVYGNVVWLIYAVVTSVFIPKRQSITKKIEPKPIPVPIDVLKPMTPELTAESKAGVPIIDIEGIGPLYAEKLNAIGVITTTDFLDAAGTPAG